MKNCGWLVLSFVFAVFATAAAFAPNNGIDTRAVSIPYYDDERIQIAMTTPMDFLNPEWKGFVTRNGAWLGNQNRLTGIMHKGYGGSIHVGIPQNESSARDLARAFLSTERSFLRVAPENLELVSSRHRWGHWIVAFGQKFNGLNVYNSKIMVNISDRGNIVEFTSDYYPDINISTSPAISAEQAIQFAGIGVSSGNNFKSSTPELIVFPIPGEAEIQYKLAYKVEISTDEPSKWLTIVDAANGQVLYRKDMIYYYTFDGFVNGEIYPATPFDTPETNPFKNELVRITGVAMVYTDTNGFFTADANDQNTNPFTVNLEGRYVVVHNAQGPGASYSGNITPGDTAHILWSPLDSRMDERNSFFHTNVVHDFFKILDPDYTQLDIGLTCNVNLNQTCNAYWDGSSINFFMRGGGCENTGEIADVIYHEYGHGITEYLYAPYAPSGAQHEGWSDYTAAAITNQPLIGRGFQGENTYLRTVDNDYRYPEDWNGESHNDGMIISGALWDLRMLLAPREAYGDSLFHFARYGYSTNFEDYMVDILVYDDDDDNLFNGTPHSNEIYEAFDQHGIGPGDKITITHEPLIDTNDVNNPYPVVAIIESTVTPPNADSIFVCYRLERNSSYNTILMQPTGLPAEYSGLIPAQPYGTLIEYYISVTDIHGRNYLEPSSAPLQPHFFVVGSLTTRLYDNFEIASGWTVGGAEDNARRGIWVRVDPIGTFSDTDPNFPYQPEDDHTLDPGVNCYITGQHVQGQSNGYADVDSGQTTLTTPVLDFSSYESPVIEYWRWFTDQTNFDDTFYVDISNDNGQSWISLEMVPRTENYWRKKRFLVNQFITPTSQMKIRFIAEDRGLGSMCEGGVDDFSVYSFDVTGVDEPNNNLVPKSFSLRQNYPNPFNPSTEISFDLPMKSEVVFTIYDIAGRLVYSNQMGDLEAGNHSLIWNANDFASGIYLYKIQADDFSQTRKMTLLK